MSIIRERQDLMDQIKDINQILENEKSDEKRKRYRELLEEKVEELEGLEQEIESLTNFRVVNL
ncbi:MAG: hypothetical protein GX457_12625 [Thermotogaceae bacterium]|nr:hypothetical protein [Thermotogaceae bacterium]